MICELSQQNSSKNPFLKLHEQSFISYNEKIEVQSWKLVIQSYIRKKVAEISLKL